MRCVAASLFALAGCLAWALTACETFPTKADNSCVIDAVGFQQYLIAQDQLDRNHTWNKLLRYNRSGIRHMVNVYRNVEGFYYWHDAAHGDRRMFSITAENESDSMAVAAEISPAITWAAYEMPSNPSPKNK